jgi:HlyD family secretion protein
MKRLVLPLVGLLAAFWATFSIARTQPRREATLPPTQPPVSEFQDTVAAVGLVEASTENISVGSPLSAVVAKVFVTAGQAVKRGDSLFELDSRHLHADREVKGQALVVAIAQEAVARARKEDLQRQLGFATQVKDSRAISQEELSRRSSAVQTAEAELQEREAQVEAAQSQLRAVEVELERSIVRSPIDAEVLQVKVRAGEFAPAAATQTPLVLLGKLKPLHVRVDVDEHEGWRVRPGAEGIAHLRGNADVRTPLRFVRFEPFVVPKRSLTGDSTERVDTRVLQVIYRVERDDLPLFVGQQVDVFIDAQPEKRASR